ncbi:MAG: Na/Pi cotransporter family protein [Eubacteriales bacterium]
MTTTEIIFAVFKLLGGLGIFIYGMKIMSEGLQNTAGDRLRNGLEKVTKNRFMGLGVGAGITAIIQSSSATTVMVVGFVNAGVMSVLQATPVLMGASIGTTITAQIAALKLTKIAPLFLFIGVMIMMTGKKRTVKRVGEALAGFGILFMGLTIMSDAVKPLRELQAFSDFIVNFQSPMIGILFGTLFTALIQSSSATMGILIALASEGLITLDASIYLIMGLNIGTCVTAVLASIGTSKTAKRTAMVHLIFNVTGVILFFILVRVLPIVEWVKNFTGLLYPNAANAADVAKAELANFHTLFNVTTALLLIGIPQVLIKMAEFIIPGKDAEKPQKKLKYITGASIIDTPTLALGQVLKEVKDMADLALNNFNLSMKAFFDKDESVIEQVLEQEKIVNFYNHELTSFLAKLSAEELVATDSLLIADLFHVITDLERISDHAENFVEYATVRIDQKVKITKIANDELIAMRDNVTEALEKAIIAFEHVDHAAAERVIEIEQLVDDQEIAYKENHIKRLTNGQCSPKASMIFTDLVTNLERVADHSTNIAYTVLEGQR